MARRKPVTPLANRGAVETRPAFQAALQDASGLGSLQNNNLDPAWPPPEDLPGGRPRKRRRKAKAEPEGPQVETCVVWAAYPERTWPLARIPLGEVEAALPAGANGASGSGASPSQPAMQQQQLQTEVSAHRGASTDAAMSGSRAGTLCLRLAADDDPEDAAVATFVAENSDGDCVGAVRMAVIAIHCLCGGAARSSLRIQNRACDFCSRTLVTTRLAARLLMLHLEEAQRRPTTVTNATLHLRRSSWRCRAGRLHWPCARCSMAASSWPSCSRRCTAHGVWKSA